MTGSAQTRLIVIRGNSGSGKSSISKGIRERYGRGIAWVSRDLIRRDILHDSDMPGHPNIGLIDLTARYALDHGFHVVLDGILQSRHYTEMLLGLVSDHLGITRCYYLDIPFDETILRHQQRPLSRVVTAEMMRRWYTPRDTIAGLDETVWGQTISLEEAVTCIMSETGLATGATKAPTLRSLTLIRGRPLACSASYRHPV